MITSLNFCLVNAANATSAKFVVASFVITIIVDGCWIVITLHVRICSFIILVTSTT